MKNNHVLLIAPPCIDLYRGMRNVAQVLHPLGLLYLAAYLESQGVKVKVYDAFAEGASMEDIEACIAQSDSEVVGITSVTTTIREAVHIAEMAKKLHRTTVLGGPHATVVPQDVLERHPCFDYVVRGEGERTFHEFLSGASPADIHGLAYRDGSRVCMTQPRELIQDISSLPFPARHLVNNSLYGQFDTLLPNHKRTFTIITARGCPNQCTFCASKTLWGTCVRFRTPENIIQELEVMQQLGMEQLIVADDTFTLKFSRIKPIVDKIKSMNIKWTCYARANNLTPDLVKMLKDAHCYYLCFGIESGNQGILDRMKKGIKLEQALSAIRMTKAVGMKVACSFIVGNLGETEATIKETVDFAKKLNPDYVQFNMLTPYPGTEVYDVAKQKGMITHDYEEYTNPKFSDPVMALDTLDSRKLKTYCMNAYKSVYLSPRFILKNMYNSLTSWGDFRRNLHYLKTFLNISREA